jgi:hypothetical protein
MRTLLLMQNKRFAVLLASASVISSSLSQPTDAHKNKGPNSVEGVNEQFKGIMSPANEVTMSDPLWMRYAYAGKKDLERRDIDAAQKYMWASSYALEDQLKKEPKTHLSNVARNLLIDVFALSNDVFFQDPHSTNIQDTPPPFPQPLQASETSRVDAEIQKMAEEQKTFDKAHPDFDGGARLRMVHLRRRIEFSNKMLPLILQIVGQDDGLTQTIREIITNDSSEFKEISTQG